MADLNLDVTPKPTQFNVLKKWCLWITSPDEEEECGYVINATTFGMLVDFKAIDGTSLFQKPVSVSQGGSGFDQKTFNAKMEKVEEMTTEQIAAIPAVMKLINKVGSKGE
jgi:hypothetical protein